MFFPDQERVLSTVQSNYTADALHMRQLLKFLWFRITVDRLKLKPSETARVGLSICLGNYLGLDRFGLFINAHGCILFSRWLIFDSV